MSTQGRKFANNVNVTIISIAIGSVEISDADLALFTALLPAGSATPPEHIRATLSTADGNTHEIVQLDYYVDDAGANGSLFFTRGVEGPQVSDLSVFAGGSVSIRVTADTLQTLTDHVLSGSGAPGFIPGHVGQHYIDTASAVHYIASGTTSSSDWNNVSAGGGGASGWGLVDSTTLQTNPGSTGDKTWNIETGGPLDFKIDAVASGVLNIAWISALPLPAGKTMQSRALFILGDDGNRELSGNTTITVQKATGTPGGNFALHYVDEHSSVLSSGSSFTIAGQQKILSFDVFVANRGFSDLYPNHGIPSIDIVFVKTGEHAVSVDYLVN